MNQQSSSGVYSVSIDNVMMKWKDGSFSIGDDLLFIDNITPQNFNHRALQLGFLLVVLCTEGEGTFALGRNEYMLKKGNMLLLLGGEQLLTIHTMSDNFKGTAILMSRSYAQGCITGLNYMWPYLLYVMQNPVVQLTDDEFAWIQESYQLLRARLQKKPGKFMFEAVVALTRAFYFEVCSMLADHVTVVEDEAMGRTYVLFDHFIRLASQHYHEERRVEWYAKELCVTAKYLTEVAKLVSGRTAGQWITSFVMVELKTLLLDTSLSVKEVAMKMNFPNQSFLGKYFKNLEGISPSEYRRKFGA